ncbi:hypothetical protein RJ641_027134 [Dillenia turbinata]|uniref:F-box protein n=1 Tax=Dillenia turbinata TaxID=194707 RepID=A0AAN8W9M1_9MAGN
MNRPWEVLFLVSQHLDPKAMAIASCVSKSWDFSLSSDHIWKPLCSSQFPSISNLHGNYNAKPPPSYRRLYALGQASVQRRHRKPLKARVSVEDLLFAIDLLDKSNGRILSLRIPGSDLEHDPHGLFRYDVNVGGLTVPIEAVEDGVMTWNVVMRGWSGVFTVMECKGKGSFLRGSDGWFSAELPSAGCCSCAAGSGLAADLKLGFRNEEESVDIRRREVVVERGKAYGTTK